MIRTPAPLVSTSCLFARHATVFPRLCLLSCCLTTGFVSTTENMPAGARGPREGGCGAAGGRSPSGMLPRGPEDRDPGSAERHQGPVGGDGHLHDPLSQVGRPGTLPGLSLQACYQPAMPTMWAWGPPPEQQISGPGIAGNRMLSWDVSQPACLFLITVELNDDNRQWEAIVFCPQLVLRRLALCAPSSRRGRMAPGGRSPVALLAL